MDASGKVIPGIQLVNDAGERVGNFIAEVENDKFFFSVKTATVVRMRPLMPILSFQIILPQLNRAYQERRSPIR